MAKTLEMPKLSPTMEEGILTAWHKKEGDAVEVDDLLAEVETDKATMEFRAFDKGTILKLLVPPGTQVKLGQAVAILGAPGEKVEAPAGAEPKTQSDGADSAPSEAAPNAERSPKMTDEKVAPAGSASPGAGATNPAVKPTRHIERGDVERARTAARGGRGGGSPLDRTEREAEESPRATPGGRVLASPYVRKLARERGIDLAGATGSGAGGRVIAEDLPQLGGGRSPPDHGSTAMVTHGTSSDGPSTLAAPARPQNGLAEPEARPLSMMRKTIARRLTEAKQTVPHFYLQIDVDASKLVLLREEINRELGVGEKPGTESKPLKVSLNDLLVKAVAVALVRVPECNAQFTPEAILVHRRVDISVAVAIADGLVTPVVRDADRKTVLSIAREVRELAGRARAKKLRPEEMQGGTFSISNLGMFGIDQFAAVINPPEGAILAVGQVRDEPVILDGAVVPGKRLALTLSCDHRVVDGAVGAAFLSELRSLVERPMRVLTG